MLIASEVRKCKQGRYIVLAIIHEGRVPYAVLLECAQIVVIISVCAIWQEAWHRALFQ